MGSLCCVAARPHGTNTASRDWSVGPHEPYWRTNTSFSPPPSRWDVHFQSEGMPQGLQDGIRFCESSASSDSKESQSWLRENWHPGHHCSTSNGAGMYLSSPSDLSQGPQWTPPVHESNISDYESTRRRDSVLRQLPCTPGIEGTPRNADVGGSFSSRSDSSESERNIRLRLPSHRNFPSRRFSLSKPVHPLAFPCKSRREASEPTGSGFSDFEVVTPQRDGQSWSSGNSSTDSTDLPESVDSESFCRPAFPSSNVKCGLCDRFLAQRSPWSSGRIMRSGDMPVAGILSCRHVFHAECLEQTTPKTRKNDPPCPICDRSTGENSPDQRAFPRIRNGFPKLKPFREDGPSRTWGCAQVGDCVEGALHAPPCNSMILLKRSRIKKSLTSKGNTGKEFPDKLGKGGWYTMQVLNGKPTDQGSTAGCSKGEERAPR